MAIWPTLLKKMECEVVGSNPLTLITGGGAWKWHCGVLKIENLTKKHFEKMDKYNNLVIDSQEGNQHGVKWTVVPLCFEVGSRGAINEQPWNLMCKRLGFSKCSKRQLTQGGQDAAVACSYYIFLCRFLRTWEPQALVDTLERSEC